MRVGDRVKLSDKRQFIMYIEIMFENNLGIVTQVHTEWDKDDIICWDVTVEVPNSKGYMVPFGFYFADLIVVECINGQEMCNDNECKRCMSIAYDPTAGD